MKKLLKYEGNCDSPWNRRQVPKNEIRWTGEEKKLKARDY